MRTRDFGFAALGRFLAVEQYIQTHQRSSIHPLQGSGVDRTERHPSKPESSSSSQTPARSQHG
jgi:hypothetical protein